jgi:SAM-dependent methyltransferase
MAGRRSARAAGHDRDVGSFDRRAQSYERDWRSPFHAPVVAAAAEVALAALPDPAAVLDLGCGTGALLRPAGRLVLADLFATGWLRPVTALGRRRDRVHTPAELEAMFAHDGLAPPGERIYDLGPLPLVGAVVAARGYRPGGNR